VTDGILKLKTIAIGLLNKKRLHSGGNPISLFRKTILILPRGNPKGERPTNWVVRKG